MITINYQPSNQYLLKHFLKEYGNIDLQTLLNILQQGKIHRCQECNGIGTIKTLTWISGNDGDMPDYHIHECHICHGHGYTEKELKPKMEQIGWE